MNTRTKIKCASRGARLHTHKILEYLSLLIKYKKKLTKINKYSTLAIKNYFDRVCFVCVYFFDIVRKVGHTHSQKYIYIKN